MFRDAFTKLDALETEELLQQINPLIGANPYHAEKTVILSLELPFYPGYRLLEIGDHTVMPARKAFYIYGIGANDVPRITALDWTNQPIYALNQQAPLHLNEKTVIDYARFFFTFVRGRHGRFIIIENVDDVPWKDEPPVTARKTLGGLIEPLRLRGVDAGDIYVLSARMIFKDSLFKSNIKVAANGLVTLEDEELVVEDIPVLDDTFGQ